MMGLSIETVYMTLYVMGSILGAILTVVAWWQKNKNKIRKMLEEAKSNVTVNLYRRYQKMYKDWKQIFVKEFDEALKYNMTQADYEGLTHEMIKETVAIVKKYKKPIKKAEPAKGGQ